jgi:hypothetical protein
VVVDVVLVVVSIVLDVVVVVSMVDEVVVVVSIVDEVVVVVSMVEDVVVVVSIVLDVVVVVSSVEVDEDDVDEVDVDDVVSGSIDVVVVGTVTIRVVVVERAMTKRAPPRLTSIRPGCVKTSSPIWMVMVTFRLGRSGSVIWTARSASAYCPGALRRSRILRSPGSPGAGGL